MDAENVKIRRKKSSGPFDIAGPKWKTAETQAPLPIFLGVNNK
jgi:hypothetical protein